MLGSSEKIGRSLSVKGIDSDKSSEVPVSTAKIGEAVSNTSSAEEQLVSESIDDSESC